MIASAFIKTHIFKTYLCMIIRQHDNYSGFTYVYLKRTLYFINLYFEDAQPELMIFLYTLFLDITRITKLLISYYRQNIRDDEILFHHSDLFDKRTGRVLLWKL